EVAMDDSARMRMLERARELDEHRNDLQIARTPKTTEIAAGGELHGEYGGLLLPLGGKNLEDARMIEPADDLMLALQCQPRSLVARELGSENFDGELRALP